MPDRIIPGKVATLRDVYSKDGVSGALSAIAHYLIPHPYNSYANLIEAEWSKPSVPIPIRTRINLVRQGFLSHRYYLYGFDNGADPANYLSEYARQAYTDRINESPELLDDKNAFHELVTENGFSDYIPDQLGRIRDGTFESTAGQTLLATLFQEDRLVIKSPRGGGGDNVYVCETVDDSIFINGSEYTVTTFETKVRSFESYVVQEYVEQADFLNNIYPEAANTARILTMQPEEEDPFIAIAVQRIGSKQSGKLDNFSQGGLSAVIDVETGELGQAVADGPGGKPHWHTMHPDTGAPIEGVAIPGWNEIRDQLLVIAEELPEIQYAGWDVLVTDPGEFVLIEANNWSDIDLLQAHKPLLSDDRVREFYANNGVPV